MPFLQTKEPYDVYENMPEFTVSSVQRKYNLKNGNFIEVDDLLVDVIRILVKKGYKVINSTKGTNVPILRTIITEDVDVDSKFDTNLIQSDDVKIMEKNSYFADGGSRKVEFIIKSKPRLFMIQFDTSTHIPYVPTGFSFDSNDNILKQNRPMIYNWEIPYQEKQMIADRLKLWAKSLDEFGKPSIPPADISTAILPEQDIFISYLSEHSEYQMSAAADQAFIETNYNYIDVKIAKIYVMNDKNLIIPVVDYSLSELYSLVIMNIETGVINVVSGISYEEKTFIPEEGPFLSFLEQNVKYMWTMLSCGVFEVMNEGSYAKTKGIVHIMYDGRHVVPVVDKTIKSNTNKGLAQLILNDDGSIEVKEGSLYISDKNEDEELSNLSIIGTFMTDFNDGYTIIATPEIGQKIFARIYKSDGSTIEADPIDEHAIYTWFHIGENIELASTPYYTITDSSKGKRLSVLIGHTKIKGSATWSSAEVIDGEEQIIPDIESPNDSE